ncbi:DNA polymerase III subunit gamma/tau [Salinisphaera sp. T31B1]|uniref:DNA polymerase III subunit gamma/tau n=1 Tax=Salinisphaera sp. T31B1 TaxID=727963 RepID=UPI003341B99C
MSFQALARTWRPRRFDELVGQSHVVRALTHALENDKLHHALLFSGTRGVGKTTLARIIAKCLNCDHGVSAHPCRGEDACSTCREIDEGRFVDLIEVDAASRTGVDDTRELMDNVQYAPTRGRTKVYLIDEVHMLSKHSFNALLKTLEEPPPRVQFLLATTEPEKIPVTILSRCLQFPLKRLPAVEIAAQLRHIIDAESLTAQDDALAEIARAADGSMRDGLSLLDQAIAFGGGELAADEVRDMLGTIGQARVAELVDAIIAPDAPAALDALAGLYAQGIDMRYLLEALATTWQHIATIQVIGEAIDEAGQPWVAAAERADSAAVQLFYDICIAGIRDLAYAPDPLIGVKMSVLRMLAFAPVGNEAEQEPAPKPPEPSARETSPAPPDNGQSAAQRAAAALRAQLSGKRPTHASTLGPEQSPGTAPVQSDTERAPADRSPPPARSAQTPPMDSAGPAGPAEPMAGPPAGPDVSGMAPAADGRSGDDEQSRSTPADEAMAAQTPPSSGTNDSQSASTQQADAASEPPPVNGDHAATTAVAPTGQSGSRGAANGAIADTGVTGREAPAAERVAAHDEAQPPFGADAFDPKSAQTGPDEAAPADAASGMADAVPGAAPSPVAAGDHPEDWARLLPRLGLTGFAAQLANNGRCQHLDDERVVLALARANEFLATPGARETLQQALADHWAPAGAPRLAIEYVDQADDTPAQRIEQDAQARQRDAVASIENDPVVRQLKERLGARVRPETIKPYRAEHAVQQRDEQ